MLMTLKSIYSYCIKVLNNDVALFQKAYDLLGSEKDESKLEVGEIMLDTFRV